MIDKNKVAALRQQAEDILEQVKKRGIDQAEISASSEVGFSVSARMGDVEKLEHHQEKDLTLTVYHDQRTGSASTSDFSEAAVKALIDKACVIAQYTDQDPCSGLADAALMASDYQDPQLYYHWDITPDQAIKMAIDCETLARKQDARIKQTEEATVSTYDGLEVYANSHGFTGSYLSSFHQINCSLVAEENKVMQRDYEYTCARDPSNLQAIDWVAKQAAENTVKRLGARQISTRNCPVIFSPKLSKGLLGRFISAISGGSLYRKSSFLVDHLGKTIFPEHVSIYQRPHILGGYGSTPFDNQGVKTSDLDYIKEGVLTNYVLGSYSARKLGMETTGNAGGVFNLFVSHSDHSLSDLFKEMGQGLFVTELLGQGVNLLTGVYSRGAAGFWIENGEVQFPVNEVTIASNLKDMFANIVAIGNDVDKRTNLHTGSIWIDNMTVAGR